MTIGTLPQSLVILGDQLSQDYLGFISLGTNLITQRPVKALDVQRLTSIGSSMTFAKLSRKRAAWKGETARASQLKETSLKM